MATRYSLVITAGPDRKRQPLLKFTERSKFLSALLNLMSAIGSGTAMAGVFDLQLDDGTNGTAGTPPSQTVTYTAPAGAQTVVIGGKSVAFTAGADATTTAAAGAAAINADPVTGLGAVASNVAGVLTVKLKVHARLYGMVNGVTFSATGTGAAAGGATMVGGVSALANGFTL